MDTASLLSAAGLAAQLDTLSNLSATPTQSIVRVLVRQSGTNPTPRGNAVSKFVNEEMLLTPTDPEFAAVVAAVLAAATRRVTELQPQLVAVAASVASAALADPLLAPAVQAAVASAPKL